MNELVDCARETAAGAARAIRSYGADPQPVDAVVVTAIFFTMLERNGHLVGDLDARARGFAALLVVVEEAMMLEGKP